jgi:hypothetical protein
MDAKRRPFNRSFTLGNTYISTWEHYLSNAELYGFHLRRIDLSDAGDLCMFLASRDLSDKSFALNTVKLCAGLNGKMLLQSLLYCITERCYSLCWTEWRNVVTACWTEWQNVVTVCLTEWQGCYSLCWAAWQNVVTASVGLNDRMLLQSLLDWMTECRYSDRMLLQSLLDWMTECCYSLCWTEWQNVVKISIRLNDIMLLQWQNVATVSVGLNDRILLQWQNVVTVSVELHDRMLLQSLLDCMTILLQFLLDWVAKWSRLYFQTSTSFSISYTDLCLSICRRILW